MNRNESKIKQKLLDILKEIVFRYSNISFPNQVIILLSILGIVSLFLPWILDNDNFISWNSFYSISGNIGYIMMIIYLVLIFLTVSTSYKEKIKLYADLNLKNYIVVITSGVFSVFFSIIMVSFVNGLSTLGENIVHGNGLILSMVIGILLIIFGIIIRNNYKKTSGEIILEQLNQNREKAKKKDNMKLPI